jgi:Tfp pilus assembly PilM family ATPase
MSTTSPQPLTYIHLNDHKILPFRDYTEGKYLRLHNRFATACGLALQGLGLVPFSVNLLPPQKSSSFLSRIKGSFRKKQAPAAWGFDFGQSCFKAVRVTYDHDGVLAVDECFQCHHPQAVQPDDEDGQTIEHITDEQIAQLLAKEDGPPNPFASYENTRLYEPVTQERFQSLAIDAFLEKYEYQGESICVGYPGHDILCHNFSLPQMTPQQTWQAIQIEAKHHLADNPNLFQIGYHILGWEEDEQNVMKQYAHYFLARESTIDGKLRMLQKHGIEPNLMTSNILANLNYAYLLLTLPPAPPQATPDEEQNPPEQDGDFEPPEIQSILVCDMGTQGTDLTFYNLREIRHFYLSIGGQHFTKSIASAFGEPFSQAEAIKRNPLKLAKKGQVIKAMTPVVGILVDDILRRLNHLRHSGAILDKVVVLGGGFQLNGFAGYFKSLLQKEWNNGS